MSNPNRTCRAVFNSKTKQRGDATGRPAGLDPPNPEVGPGSYDPKPGNGHPYWKPWHIDPIRQTSTFASKTQKTQAERPLTA